jgi:hypothetical protein
VELQVVIFLGALFYCLYLVVSEEKLVKKMFWQSLWDHYLGIAGKLTPFFFRQTASPKLPPLATSWSVIIDSLKESLFWDWAANYLMLLINTVPLATIQPISGQHALPLQTAFC